MTMTHTKFGSNVHCAKV